MTNYNDYEEVSICKGCGSPLVYDGIDWFCNNKDCLYEYLQVVKMHRAMKEREEFEEYKRLKKNYE